MQRFEPTQQTRWVQDLRVKNDGHVLHKYKVIGMHVILRWKEIWMGERTDDNTLDPAMSSDINAGQ